MASITPRGVAIGRYCRSLLIARGDPMGAVAYAMGQNWRDTPEVLDALKAAVAPQSTAATAGEELTLPGPLAFDLVELLRPQTIVGRLQAAMRKVPFNIKLPSVASGLHAAWVGEGQPTPMSKMDFDLASAVTWAKISALAATTTELVKLSNPAADAIIANDIAKAIAFALDSAFISPDNAGSAGVKPASVSNGASTIHSAGSSVANIDSDLREALAVLNGAFIDLSSAYWITSPRTATYLATVRGSGGAPAYPLMTARGGTLLGLPALTSAAAFDLSSPSESFITLLAASETDIADDGDARIEVSTNASIQMDDAPSSGAFVSAWQSGLAVTRATRYVSWKLRRSAAVALVDQIQF